MLKIWIKHKIYEYCIDTLFDNVQRNFTNNKATEYFRAIEEFHRLNDLHTKYLAKTMDRTLGPDSVDSPENQKFIDNSFVKIDSLMEELTYVGKTISGILSDMRS